MILVPLLNPKFANTLAAQSCELRVRGTSRTAPSEWNSLIHEELSGGPIDARRTSWRFALSRRISVISSATAEECSACLVPVYCTMVSAIPSDSIKVMPPRVSRQVR